jgi:cytochrome c oxidase subunit 2
MFSLNRLMGMPDNASEHGYTIDHMLEFCHWFMLALALGWSIFFVYTLWRFRAGKSPKADYYGVRTKASTHVEFMVVLIDVLLLIGFAVPLWSKRVLNFPLGDAITVKVVGQQFTWNFHYAGPDGVFGAQDPSLISTGNQLGLDPNDPHGRDDIVTPNEMHIPVNHNIILEVTSKDVIHSVAIQAMRIGQDAIPGSNIPIWFKPVKTGTYEIVCAQLCGQNHSLMKATVVVDTEEDYKAWLDDEEKLNAPPPVPPPAKPAAAASSVRALVTGPLADFPYAPAEGNKEWR